MVQKTPLRKKKKTSTDEEKIFANHRADKGLCSECKKRACNNKANNPIRN